jgi:hypothetical protein
MKSIHGVRKLLPCVCIHHGFRCKVFCVNSMERFMSVPYLREAAAQGDLGKFVRFVRLHLGDGNEAVSKAEIDRSWVEAVRIRLRDAQVPFTVQIQFFP